MAPRPRRSIALVLAAGTVLAAAAAGASAHDKGYDTRVTINRPELHIIKGRVISDLGNCESGRRVRLFSDQPGDMEDIPLMQQRTDEEGRYEFNLGPGDRYYTVAPREIIERPGHRHVCRRDRSPTVD